MMVLVDGQSYGNCNVASGLNATVVQLTVNKLLTVTVTVMNTLYPLLVDFGSTYQEFLCQCPHPLHRFQRD